MNTTDNITISISSKENIEKIFFLDQKLPKLTILSWSKNNIKYVANHHGLRATEKIER